MERESPTSNYLKGFGPASGERILPEVDIHGTKFHIDVHKDEFREVENPANRIPFEALNETPSGHNTFFYDTSTKNVYRGSFDEMTTNDHVRFTKLPSFWDMDREGMQRLTHDLIISLRAERENRAAQTGKPEDNDQKQSRPRTKKM